MDKIKYYPVGNGDMSLIILRDGTTIAIDCNIRQTSVDSTDGTCFDVKKDVLASIKKRNDNPFIDSFVLTHGDLDHCRGFKNHYYCGDPNAYSQEDRDNKLILIDELWFSPMIAEEHSNDDEDAFQQEAERRLDLHITEHPDRNLPGNRIRIIGYDGNKDYQKLNYLRLTPGKVVSTFNEKAQTTFSLFIHAPFKETLASAEPGKNTNSIVFQARFKEKADDDDFAVLAMFGGDADYIAWEIIVTKTIESGKAESEKALDWDIFLAPHHCSWTFFNEHNEKEEAKESSLEVLRYRRSGGLIISSSKKIEDDDDNPPCYLAKTEYLKVLNKSSEFINTAEHKSEEYQEPIEFTISANGPVQPVKSDVSAARGSAGGSGAAAITIYQG
ncbi:hypothetical protein [Longitalea arenae]|uniref:hypothetical protein n=1 Tax=Longitalea arenae TaxID=2812558 RepID=UPI001968512B|nr:hypothetical protein [Longitalea arenae]